MLRTKYKPKFHVLEQALFHPRRAEECLDKLPLLPLDAKVVLKRSEARLQKIVSNNPHFAAQSFNSL